MTVAQRSGYAIDAASDDSDIVPRDCSVIAGLAYLAIVARDYPVIAGPPTPSLRA